MLEFVIKYQYYLIAICSLLLLLFIVLIWLKGRKVKPIDMDQVLDKKEEPSQIEEILTNLENTSERPMTTFEEEQEANAIISYEQLVQAVKEKKNANDFNNPNLENTDILPESPPEPEKTIEKPKFKSSEFISPVFGKDSNSNDKFLKELKDFRNNL